MSKLTLRYEYGTWAPGLEKPADDFGRLSIHVEIDRFSGKGGFWVQWQDVKEFGKALGAFPITKDSPITAQWGYDMQEDNDLILQLEIATANIRGDLVVRFEIADDDNPRNRLRGQFLTNYPELDKFRADIALVMDRKIEHADLTGQ